MKKVSVKLKEKACRYDVKIQSDALESCGDWAQAALPAATKKIALVSNKKVFRLYGEIVEKSLRARGFEVFAHLIGDGEKYKNLHVAESALHFFSEKKLTRTDAVLALGGGVVGDLAGFAAAIYLRGVAFLQIPTTLLAMIDSAVGGKTGVNSRFGKNLIGAFHQPRGVLVDAQTLKTLPARELAAGFYEAVKHGAIAHRKLFNQTAEFLEKFPLDKFKKHFADANFLAALENFLHAQIAFKAEIVMQDERENAARGDRKSRKILNFGHTTAHALERATDYKFFKHGEAVGYGIMVAAEISKSVGIFDKNELELLNGVLLSVGSLPDARNVSLELVFEAFASDKKKTDDALQWILLEAVGKPKIVSSKDIPERLVRQALIKVLKK